LPALSITIFADFTCPACYVTEAALRRRAADHGLSIRYRAAELDPAGDEPGRERELAPLAAALGLSLRAPAARPRTGKAHEAVKLARELGAEDAMRAAVYRAHWEDGRDIGRIDVLRDLAPDVGLDPFDVKVALDIDRFGDEVLRDREVARRLGIRRGPVLYLGTGPGARILIGARTEAEIETEITSHGRPGGS
jgi:predicted DsbA family dithiol-disulfide isomerase